LKVIARIAASKKQSAYRHGKRIFEIQRKKAKTAAFQKSDSPE